MIDRTGKTGPELTADEFFGWVERQHPNVMLECVITWGELVTKDYNPGRAAYIVRETVELCKAEFSTKH